MGKHLNDAIFPPLGCLPGKKVNFRLAYMVIAHDVLLRKMKRAAYCFAKETERNVNEDIRLDEKNEEQPPLQNQPNKVELEPGKNTYRHGKYRC